MGHAIEWLRAELAAKVEELAQADAEINRLEDKLTVAMRAIKQIDERGCDRNCYYEGVCVHKVARAAVELLCAKEDRP